ncbi:MAG: indole-3-glycerol phosphate synthase TrpC, partial [Acidobacteriota bacterium]
MLDRIVAQKQLELVESKAGKPFEALLAEMPDSRPPSLGQAFRAEGIRIIAEVKYSSPSHGPFAIQWPPQEVVKAYLDGGAAAVSVLTDREFFDGKPEYLQRVGREFPELALLRKDFLIDRYQVLEARVWGASAYLLIVACLEPGQLRSLMGYGAELGLEALVEVHGLRELETAVESG